MRVLIYILFFLFFFPALAFAWGGLEHSAITSAALTSLAPAVLTFLGTEASRLIKVYCMYPDFNWAFYGSCTDDTEDNVRREDKRRDFNASFYCDFDEFTGKGEYIAHRPEIDILKKYTAPDEHCLDAFNNRRFTQYGVKKFFDKSFQAFKNGQYIDGIRLAGVFIHYLEDCTSPPHALGISGNLHEVMEKLKDCSSINIRNYKPRFLGKNFDEASGKIIEIANDISEKTFGIAGEIKSLIKANRMKMAERKKCQCTMMAAMGVADALTTLYELIKNDLPYRKLSQHKVNLLCNPSFDTDTNNDMQPDGWIREWYDLTCPFDMHLYDKVGPRKRKGACVRLYKTSDAGAGWRTARSASVPVREGETFELNGWIRPQTATGENHLALRFENVNYETVAEFKSKNVTGTKLWHKIAVKGKTPPGAVDLLAACVSKNNSGSVLFDDFTMYKV